MHRLNRRAFLFSAAASLCVKPAEAGPVNEFRGVYPIMQTPFLSSGELDYDTLAKEVTFLDRAGVHGIVWPQLASEYARLTFDERIQGAKTIVEAARDTKPKVVIGVQAEDTATAVRHAAHAAKIRPDAIIALPPRKEGQSEFDLDAIADYYVAIGEACDLPLFIQAIGNVSVEFLLELMDKVPSLHFVKDEAGHTLSRVTELNEAKKKRPLGVFTGGHGKTLIDEMARGSAGNMPGAAWADLYASAWDLWHAGERGPAIDLFSKALLYVTQVQAYGLAALHYVLHLRGVFPNWKTRNPQQRPLDPETQAALRRTYEFVRPYLRA